MKTLENLANTWFYPSATLVENEGARKMICNRNKNIMLCWILVLVTYLLFMLFSPLIPSKLHFFNFGFLFTFVIAFPLLCRSHFKWFSRFYFGLVTLYPLMIMQFPEGLIFAIGSSVSVPFFIFVISTKKRYSLANIAIQIFILHQYIEHGVLEYKDIDPSYLAYVISRAITLFLVQIAIALVGIDLSLRRAQRRAYERSKIEYAYSKQKAFLMTLSHELRNPLNSMMGNIQLALFENNNKEAIEFLENAQMCGELLLHLINNILDTGKLEVGELEVHPTSQNLHKLLERIWGVSSKVISQKGINGIFKLSKNIPKFVEADAYRITQVLFNLINNSVKFTDKGSISVKVEWLEDHISVNDECFLPIPFDSENEGIFEKEELLTTTGINEDYDVLSPRKRKSSLRNINSRVGQCGVLKISVSDTGCGISEADKGKLFKKFSQVHSDTSKRKIGTGLGLYISYELCKKMNGDIRVYSMVNRGTSFVICLPLKISAPPPGYIEESLSSSNQILTSCLHKRALIVENSNHNLHIFSKYLKKMGFNMIYLAENGQEAYQKYVSCHKEQNLVHLILIDYDLPGLSGKQTLAKIREYERNSKLQHCHSIIMSSRYEGSFLNIEEDENKVIGYTLLRKPITFHDLHDAVKGYL